MQPSSATYTNISSSFSRLLDIQESLDSQLAYHLHHLPLTIDKTRKRIISRIKKVNHMYLTMLSGIGGARVINTAASQSAKAAHTYVDLLTVTGQSLVTGSFSASRVAKIINPSQVGCGVKEYNHVWSYYPQLGDLETTYRCQISSSCTKELPVRILPHVLKVKVVKLMGEIRNSLVCLLMEEEGKELHRELEIMTKTMIRRLDHTQEIIDALDISIIVHTSLEKIVRPRYFIS